MNERDFLQLQAEYEHTFKPAWPRWWYGVAFLACIAALILIMCSST
jgi:hypothetical protein